MRAEAQKRMNDLRWLREAGDYLESARAELLDSPDDVRLKAFICLTEEVVAYERRRLGGEADAPHEPPGSPRRAQELRR